MSENILEIRNLSYTYPDGDGKRIIFENASISFEKGKFCSITGESGSGKTTLLYCIGGLDEDYEGEILYEGKEIREIGLENYRRNMVSMVYQNYNLIPYLSSLQNIRVAVDITDNRKDIGRKEACSILGSLGMDRRKAIRKASSLSGGEQQRVAIARAVAIGSSLIIADEPTGNLDEETGYQVMELFRNLCEEGKTVIMVTHNRNLAECCDMQYHIDQKSGKIILVK